MSVFFVYQGSKVAETVDVFVVSRVIRALDRDIYWVTPQLLDDIYGVAPSRWRTQAIASERG
jgi:phenylalanine-4-hydroxylase